MALKLCTEVMNLDTQLVSTARLAFVYKLPDRKPEPSIDSND
jgi:hypothetical protein